MILSSPLSLPSDRPDPLVVRRRRRGSHKGDGSVRLRSDDDDEEERAEIQSGANVQVFIMDLVWLCRSPVIL